MKQTQETIIYFKLILYLEETASLLSSTDCNGNDIPPQDAILPLESEGI